MSDATKAIRPANTLNFDIEVSHMSRIKTGKQQSRGEGDVLASPLSILRSRTCIPFLEYASLDNLLRAMSSPLQECYSVSHMQSASNHTCPGPFHTRDTEATPRPRHLRQQLRAYHKAGGPRFQVPAPSKLGGLHGFGLPGALIFERVTRQLQSPAAT
jgi:hypothetical protein